MKKVYESPDFIMIGHCHNLLMADGIPSLVKNQHLTGAVGELPMSECWVELWVESDGDYARAETIIQVALSVEQESGPDWECASCHETNEYQFAVCWNCGEPN